MTQALAAVRLRSLRMPTAGSLAVAALLLVLPLLLGDAVQDPNRIRFAVAVAALVALLGVATCSRRLLHGASSRVSAGSSRT